MISALCRSFAIGKKGQYHYCATISRSSNMKCATISQFPNTQCTTMSRFPSTQCATRLYTVDEHDATATAVDENSTGWKSPSGRVYAERPKMGTKVQELIRHKPLMMESARNPEENKRPANLQQPYGSQVRVKEIKVRKGKAFMEVLFTTGERFVFGAEFLRVESPSAEVQGHGAADEKRLVYYKRGVTIASVDYVGNYAVRIVFSDEHDTGIYTWSYLYDLGRRKYTLQKRYIEAMRRAGRSRSPRTSGTGGQNRSGAGSTGSSN